MTTQQNDRIGGIIRECDAQGWHRTGTETDYLSAQWFAERLRRFGLEPSLEPFELSRIGVEAAYLEVGGRRIEGVPLFDGAFTGPEGIGGRLGPLGSEARIGAAEVGPVGRDEEFMAARRSTAHAALVAVTLVGRPGLAVRNAKSFLSPFGPPVLQVGSEVRGLLDECSQAGSEARVVVRVSRSAAESYNVVAELKGREEGLSPLVVMTPRSGWWNCAAERGGGIACWLEVVRALSQAGAARNVLFVATSGHELGLLGIEAFLQERPRIPDEAHAWVHFGASIGAAHEPALQLAASHDGLDAIAVESLTRAGAGPVSATPRGNMVGAESNIVYERGARCVALAGPHALFHNEADRWPDAVDVPSVARYANAFAEVAMKLAADGHDSG